MPPKLAKVLIVEDHKPLREALARAVSAFSAEVMQADDVRSAEAQLEGHPDVVLVDVWLPDGSGQRVVEHAVRLRPAPAVIAMSGHASAEEAFDLARAGARRYLAKPIALEDLMRSIDEALADRPDLSPLVVAHVGHTPLREVMTSEVKYCFEDQDLDEVTRNMGDIQVRRLPVVDRGKRLVGILSLGDIALGHGEASSGKALGGISRPGGEHCQTV